MAATRTSAFPLARTTERCPYCHDVLDEAAQRWRCPDCPTDHHVECASIHGGCALLGCTGRVVPRPIVVRILERSRRSWFGRLVRLFDGDLAALRRRDPVAILGLLMAIGFASLAACLFVLIASYPYEPTGIVGATASGLHVVGTAGVVISVAGLFLLAFWRLARQVWRFVAP